MRLSIVLFIIFLIGCGDTTESRKDVVKPTIVTEAVPNDSDDPAIWYNETNPSASLILGTDKGDENGGLYVFGLDGKIDRDKSISTLQRPNNVDVEYGFVMNGDTIDIAVVTERGRNMLRVYSVPEMKAIDGGGIPVFEGSEQRAPMGVTLYKRPSDGSFFALVSRKTGPSGSYIWQYELLERNGNIVGEVLRKFGEFSGGEGEIEALVADDMNGVVYYSDELYGIRKYYADPDSSGIQLTEFGQDAFKEDREGLSIFVNRGGDGFLLASDQQANNFHVFSTKDGHKRIKIIAVSTNESDGSDVIAKPLNEMFSKGLFVAMSDDKTFQFYRLEDLAGPALNFVTSMSTD